MATKPSLVPTWNTGGANNTAPTAPKIVLGWTNGERPASSYLNHRMKLYGEWCQYLSDGAFTGNHTFGGTVGVTGAVTCSSTLGVTGAVALSSTLSVASTLTASNGFTLTTGAANLNGATSISLPKRRLQLPSSLGQLSSGTATWSGGYWSGGAAGTVYLPIPLHEGDRIKKITIRHKRGGGTPIYALKRLDYATLGAAIASVSIGSGTTDTESVIDSGGSDINHTIAAGYQYIIEASIGNAADAFYMATVEYDRP
jgi:hypothetical protein